MSDVRESTGLYGVDARPKRVSDIRQFTVADEMVVVSSLKTADIFDRREETPAITLNASGRAIWDLCDGTRSEVEIIDHLAAEFGISRDIIEDHVTTSLSEFARLGFIERWRGFNQDMPSTVFVTGIEDKPYFWWQTALFLESFRDKLPLGWGTLIVVCNNGNPISSELKNILDRYGTPYVESRNHADGYRIDIGKNDGESHAAINRVEALKAAAEWVGDDDVICLLDCDVFLYGGVNFEIMPAGCAMARNWHIEHEPFFATVDRNEGKGINLPLLLESMGCLQPFKPGGVNVFMTGKVAKNEKVIADCYRFAHALFLLAHAADVPIAWMAEMPCFALALTANGIDYDLLEREELLVSSCDESSIPEGTLYHYYSDPKDFGRYAFQGSSWHKQAYVGVDFLATDFSEFAERASTDHERYFFKLATQAKARLNV